MVRRLPALLALLTPALAAAAGRGAPPHVRTAPELSDVALAVCAVVAVWFVRRALRTRFRKAADPRD